MEPDIQKTAMAYADLKGKVFAITGAASGMGREISIRLAKQGVKLGLIDLQKPDNTLAEVEAVGGEAISLTCNVTVAAQVERAFQAVVDRFGKLDGAANMAGIIGAKTSNGAYPSIDELVDQDWDKVLGVNLDGVKNSLRVQMKLIKGAGSIVNAASIMGQVGSKNSSPYVASKWGVIGLTKCAAQEGGPRGLRVNAVAP